MLELTTSETVQILFAAVSFLVILAFGLFSRQQQKRIVKNFIKIQDDLIKREEAFRVKPRLLFFGPHIENDTLSLRVKNVGRGYAFDVKLKIAIDKWVKKKKVRSTTVNLGNVPSNPEPAHFPTRIKINDIIKKCKGEIIIWGTMKDEEESVLEIIKQSISVKSIQKQYEEEQIKNSET